MTRPIALAGVFLSVLAIGGAYASAFLPGGAPPAAAWAMAFGIAALMVSTMALGALRREGGLGPLRLPFALVFLIVAGGFAVVLALPPADPADPALWLGLPPRAAVVLYGIGLLPLFTVPVAYALTFDRMTLSEADLERVRSSVVGRRPSVPPPLPPVGPQGTDDRRLATGVAGSGEVGR